MARFDSGGFGSTDSTSEEWGDTADDDVAEATQLTRGGDEGQQSQSDETTSTTQSERTGQSSGRRGELSASPISAGDDGQTATQEQQSQKQNDETLRANESRSLSTTGVGTTGTRQSRMRARTPMASGGSGFGTDTFGTTVRSQSNDGATVERADNIGGDATTSADRELQQAEQSERVRETVEQNLEEQGVDTDEVNIDVQRGMDGFSAEVTAREQEEQFGDITLEFGGQTDDTRTQIGTRLATNEANPAAPENYTGAVTFEEAVGDLSTDYSSFIGSQFSTDYDTLTGDAVGFVAGEEAGDTADAALQTTAESSLQSLNPFQAALGLKEGTEFVGYTAAETARGNLGVNVNPEVNADPTATELLRSERDTSIDDDFITTTEDGLVGRVGRAGGAAASAGVDYATENPVKAGGTVVGSLLGTAAVMGAASRVGKGAGFASRAAIQPGEELAGVGGYYATRAVSSTRTADRLFPNKEPLIFSEEAAIRAAKKVSPSVKGLRQTQFTARATPYQAELVRRFGPGAGGSGTLDEFGVAERTRSTVPPRSELGSDTESILDATTSVEVDAEASPTASTRSSSEAPMSVESEQPGAGELPLAAEIQEAGSARAYIRGEELPGEQRILMSEVENFKSLFNDERGQASMLPRSRTRQESPGTSEFDQEMVSNELQRQQLAQRRQLSGDFEGEMSPFRTRELEGEQPRIRRTTETEAETDVSTTPRAELFIPQETGAVGENLETNVGLATGVRSMELTDTVLETEIGTGIEQESEQEIEQEVEQEIEQEFGQEVEQEFEQEVEQELEAETRREVEMLFEPADDTDEDADEALFGGLREDVLTDFRNPLTGDTEVTDSEPQLPGFLGS